MATRWRLTATTTDPAVLPAVQSYTHALTDIRQLLTSDSSTLTNTTLTPDAADHLSAGDTGFVQFVSAPLGTNVFTAGDAFKYAIQGQEAHTNNNLFVQVWIGIYSNDGSTLLATLRSKVADGTELATASTNRTFSGTLSGSYTTTGGERLVIEISLTGTPGPAASGVQGHNGQLRFGGSGASGDLPEDDTDISTAKNPWLEFANTVSFDSTVNPSAISATASLPAPTATGTAQTTPSPVAASASVPAASATGSAVASPGAIAAVATTPDPTASGTAGGVTASPDAIAATATTPSPAASGTGVASPGPVAATTALPAPSGAGDALAAPAAIASTTSLGAPSASGGGLASPEALSVAATTPAPATTGGATASPGAISALAATPQPTGIGAGAAVPDAIVVVTELPTPEIFLVFRDIELELGAAKLRWVVSPATSRWHVDEADARWRVGTART